MCDNPLCNEDRNTLIINACKEVFPEFYCRRLDPNEKYYTPTTICRCVDKWQLYISATTCALGCYPTIRKARANRYLAEMKYRHEPNKNNLEWYSYCLACAMLLDNRSVNSGNTKTVINTIAKMGLTEVISQIANPSVVSIGNNKRNYPKKPHLSNEVREFIFAKHSRVCSHIQDHVLDESKRQVCSACDGTGVEYMDYMYNWYPKSKLDISHTPNGAWAVNLDPTAYLDYKNMFIELASDNRKRAKQEERQGYINLCNQGHNLSEDDFHIIVGCQELLDTLPSLQK